MIKNLFVVPASAGHFYPLVELASLLMSRGEDALFIIDSRYEQLCRTYGIPYIGVSNNLSSEAFLHVGHWFYEQQVFEQAGVIEDVVLNYRPDRVVTSVLCLSALLTAERFQLPTIFLGYSINLFPSNSIEPNSEGFQSKQWRYGEFCKLYNQVRSKVGLSLVDKDEDENPFYGSIYLTRLIPSLDHSNCYPSQVLPIGSTLYSVPHYRNPGIDLFIERCKSASKRLVYIQIGRLFDSSDIWHSLMEQMLQADDGTYYLIDVGRGDYYQPFVKNMMSDKVFIDHFIPVGQYAEYVDCIISSGQTTTFLAAIQHNLPILSLPYSADGIEVSKLIQSMKIGDACFEAKTLTGKRITELVSACCVSEKIKIQLAAYKKVFQDCCSEDRLYTLIKEMTSIEDNPEDAAYSNFTVSPQSLSTLR